MAAEEKLIYDICREVAADMGDGTSRAMLDRFEAFVQTQTAKSGSLVDDETAALHRRRFVFIAAAIAVVLIPLLLVIGYNTGEKELPFWFQSGNRLAGKPGKSLSTGPEERASIDFHNGSVVTLEENTAVAVVKSSTKEVRFDMAGGDLFVDVEGKESGQWVVVLGPFRVSVLGTRFFVSWRETSKILDVRVERGAVLVEGTTLGDRGIVVTGGNHFRANGETGFFVMNDMTSRYYDPSSPSLLLENTARRERGSPEPPPLSDTQTTLVPSVNTAHTAAPRSGRSAPGHKIPQTTPVSKSAPTSVTARDADPQPDWRGLLERGDDTAIITAAARFGAGTLVETASLAELWRLMNAARRMERYPLTETLLLAVRQRFPGASKASLAAFVLGKINYYGKGDADAAAGWFRVYVDENPDGPLAEEALGRLIQILDERGKRAEASKLARAYIDKYPTGRLSSTVRSLLRH